MFNFNCITCGLRKSFCFCFWKITFRISDIRRGYPHGRAACTCFQLWELFFCCDGRFSRSFLRYGIWLSLDFEWRSCYMIRECIFGRFRIVCSNFWYVFVIVFIRSRVFASPFTNSLSLRNVGKRAVVVLRLPAKTTSTIAKCQFRGLICVAVDVCTIHGWW